MMHFVHSINWSYTLTLCGKGILLIAGLLLPWITLYYWFIGLI